MISRLFKAVGLALLFIAALGLSSCMLFPHGHGNQGNYLQQSKEKKPIDHGPDQDWPGPERN
jgi:hypothetical protein